MEFTDIHYDDDALAEISSHYWNWVPEGASDFYLFHRGFAGNHTDYWSFKCGSVDDCYTVAERCVHHKDREQMVEFATPPRSILAKGPGYFGESLQTPKWDLSSIKRGVMAEKTRHGKFLDFVAIDLDERRVYVTHWSGGYPEN